ncbi:MAG TPA: methyltransferase domain-containing protein, partial [Burkholderiales bacterium]|nr:methyltransferase domain-containing protein [Burkholderiales bacterium]
MTQPSDTNGFKSFEHAGWENIPAQYHDSFGSLTIQSIGPLLDAVGARSGTRVLDVATGPGYVAGAAAQRGATVVGIDFSAAMLAEARRSFPVIEFHQGDAEALPLPDDSFDAVVMNFGLLHLGHPERALAEARRVLRSRGRVGFTVWAEPKKTIGFEILLRAIQNHGTLDVPLPPAPPFFRFSDYAECDRALRDAGLTTPRVVQVPQTWRLRSADSLFDIMQGSTV